MHMNNPQAGTINQSRQTSTHSSELRAAHSEDDAQVEMGSSSSKWPFVTMNKMMGLHETPNRVVKQSHKVQHALSIDSPQEIKGNSDMWSLCLMDVFKFLDGNSLRCMSSVSWSWARQFDCRGSQVSLIAIQELLGDNYAHRLSTYGYQKSDSITSCRGDRSLQHYWISACDFLLGHLHSQIPRGSQTSTSMALALLSDFFTCIKSESLPEFVSIMEVNNLCSNSYLMAFTSIAIAVKIEVGDQEDLFVDHLWELKLTWFPGGSLLRQWHDTIPEGGAKCSSWSLIRERSFGCRTNNFESSENDSPYLLLLSICEASLVKYQNCGWWAVEACNCL